MEITVAKTAGFCFGVNRAVEIVNSLAEGEKNVCTLGPIIHNKEMVQELKDKGVYSIEELYSAEDYDTVVIRSHGVPREVYDALASMACEVVDATCPFVSKIHRIVAKAGEKNKTVLIAGDKNHPEVMGIVGHCCGECYAFKDEKELSDSLSLMLNKNIKDICVVAQTTFDVTLFEKCLKIIKKVYTNAEIFDTICNATSERQAEAESLSKSSDCMIIIGDKHSSNTCKLFSICKRNCENTFLVETEADLDLDIVSKAESIGVTAGASTPARIIKEVLDTMNDVIKSSETNEFENFEEMLEESLKSLNTNERVMGTVVGIAPNEVFVDVGRKQAGFIPLDELSATPINNPEDVVKIGDELELLIMKTNDQEGTIMLSKRRVDAKKGWELLEKAYEEKEILTGVVTEVINGGVIVVALDSRVFVPASQATLNRDEDLEALKGQEVQFRLIEVSQRGRRRKVIGSIKSVLKDEFAEKRAAFWETAEVGKTYTGTVRTLTNYGAFVDLGGVSGMIHISELSWLRIKHPSEVVNVGDTVEVYIKDINDETKKISLGYKKTEDNPWAKLENEYPVGTVVNATIVGMTTFGAFANIIPGIDGLIHISQISNKRIEKPQDELKVGEVVEAKITAIDFEKKRVSLSIRELLPDAPVIPEAVVEEVIKEPVAEEAESVAEVVEEPVAEEAVAEVAEEPVAEVAEEAAEVETADAE
ncbi:MAG: bifunctional 4-hydroxy-3-methylbut-2-enyl diphosphate reductase/30S ribosomal protein S1 [Ruminococcus sp.]|nr:bifunctional 4-hydroxy-3-methylbut-2-enyl diphosphate reductase/30S ribosomal protein S1 [Ruminococcus sp.]